MTERDRAIVAWLGRFRFATAAQVQRQFGFHLRAVYARLANLRRLGLAEHQRWWHDHPGVHLATSAGLAVAGVPLPVAKVDVRTYWHTLGLVDLAADLQRAGTAVVSEREIQHRDAGVDQRGDLAYAVALGHGERGLQLHVPDLVVLEPGGDKRAVELELTAKRTRRLERILNGYRGARHLAGVAYYTPSRRIASAVERAARKLGMADLVEVHTWQPSRGQGGGP